MMDKNREEDKIDRKVWFLFSLGCFFVVSVVGFVVFAIFESIKEDDYQHHQSKYTQYEACLQNYSTKEQCMGYLIGTEGQGVLLSGPSGFTSEEITTYERYRKNGMTEIEAKNEILINDRMKRFKDELIYYNKWKNGDYP